MNYIVQRLFLNAHKMNKHFLNLKEYGSTGVRDLVHGALELKNGSHQKRSQGKVFGSHF